MRSDLFLDLSVGVKVKTKRRPRLKLSAADRVELKRLKQEKLTARVWRRILTLEHLDAGQTVRGAAKAVGGYHREVKRVADRYNAAGLQAALSDEPRPGPERTLDRVEEAAVVAMGVRPATGGLCEVDDPAVHRQAPHSRSPDPGARGPSVAAGHHPRRHADPLEVSSEGRAAHVPVRAARIPTV